jgi:hypothetical protein
LREDCEQGGLGSYIKDVALDIDIVEEEQGHKPADDQVPEDEPKVERQVTRPDTEQMTSSKSLLQHVDTRRSQRALDEDQGGDRDSV